MQTNESTTGAEITLANGFPAPQDAGNYAVNKRYRLPYVQVWNLDIQHTFPLGIVLNVGYNGSKGTRLDVVSAPGRSATESLSGVFYDWEDSIAFSNFNALAVRLRKRMQRGIAVGATYTYSHSIDDASSVGGVGGVVAQNWQDILAEESNSSFDIRHNFKGDFVYELPFGPDTHMLTNGSWLSHSLANISMSGTFQFATGEPLTPHYQANIADVARGSAGSLRPDRVIGASITEGGGSIHNWFNRDAFTEPAAVYGTASTLLHPRPRHRLLQRIALKERPLRRHALLRSPRHRQQRLQHRAIRRRRHHRRLRHLRNGNLRRLHAPIHLLSPLPLLGDKETRP